MIESILRISKQFVSLMSICTCFLSPVLLQSQPESQKARAPQTIWVEDKLSAMNLEQKIGHLMMLPAYAEAGKGPDARLLALIQKYNIGGVIMMQGQPAQQLYHLQRYQAVSSIPLMIGQDAEWGPAMRLKGALPFPKNMTLGAIRNDSLLYQMGWLMGKQLRRVGVHVNFAPVFDVNNNAANPVINRRSFGDNKYAVARKGVLLSRGLQAANVLACAKHFPGHGDTGTDSHLDLPLIPYDKTRLDTLELYPFSKAVQAGIDAVMVGHLHIPALDATPNMPATLSPNVVKDILRDSLNYDGLIFTDALNMQGVTKYFSPGEVELKALMAGNDVLLFPQNVPLAIKVISSAVKGGMIEETDLDQKVRRVLLAKYRLGLDTLHLPSADSVMEDLNGMQMKVFRKRLYESAITLAKNKDDLVPLKNLHKRQIAYVQVGGAGHRAFYQRIKKYTEVEPYFLSKSFDQTTQNTVLKKIGSANTVIIGLYDLQHNPRLRYGIRSQTIQLCKQLQAEGREVIIALFGTPYSLKYFESIDASLVAYETDMLAQEAAASAIFGGIPISGKLPVQVSELFRQGTGIAIDSTIRFGFAFPEEVGMDSEKLGKIDSITRHYIDRGAMPGCAIMIMRGDKMVYDRGFGFTYAGPEAELVDEFESTYDLASVTKIASTTISLMQLVEQGWIDLDAPLKHYIADANGTNKADLTIRRLLQHNAGLPAWVPYYRKTFKDDDIHANLDPRFCSYTPTNIHTEKIAPSFYINPILKDSLWQYIWDVEVRNTTRVRYSDVGMILLGRVIEEVSNMRLDEYVYNLFYKPLGMDHTYFNPHVIGKGSFCPPTQVDTLWRKALVQGYVHDETSAILGGVAGHAGLFANTYDLAKLLLMLKNGGTYGGETYMSDSTIQVFTSQQLRGNRKGLGWDKPEFREGRFNPVSKYCSSETYGHTGFTGTSAWVDPTFDLVYIFLSNRTFPFANNRLMQRENVRVQIMDQVYESMFDFHGM